MARKILKLENYEKSGAARDLDLKQALMDGISEERDEMQLKMPIFQKKNAMLGQLEAVGLYGTSKTGQFDTRIGRAEKFKPNKLNSARPKYGLRDKSPMKSKTAKKAKPKRKR